MTSEVIGFIIELIRGRPRFNIMSSMRVRVFLGLSEAFIECSSDELES